VKLPASSVYPPVSGLAGKYSYFASHITVIEGVLTIKLKVNFKSRKSCK